MNIMKITALLLGLSTSILLSQSQQSDPAINSAQDNLAPTPSATTPGRYQLYAATIPVEAATNRSSTPAPSRTGNRSRKKPTPAATSSGT